MLPLKRNSQCITKSACIFLQHYLLLHSGAWEPGDGQGDQEPPSPNFLDEMTLNLFLKAERKFIFPLFQFITYIPECLELSTCHANASCYEKRGSFECRCNSGFAGNGKYCDYRGVFNCYDLFLQFFLCNRISICINCLNLRWLHRVFSPEVTFFVYSTGFLNFYDARAKKIFQNKT